MQMFAARKPLYHFAITYYNVHIAMYLGNRMDHQGTKWQIEMHGSIKY